MGKKSAYSGESAKDRSINIMDKFITKNENRNKHQQLLPARRKDPNIPVNLWPLKDQLEYYDNLTDADRFDEQYSAYSTWYDTIKKQSGVYHQTFIDFAGKFKTEMREMWELKMHPKHAIIELRKKGVY
jgi:hypothetical protein